MYLTATQDLSPSSFSWRYSLSPVQDSLDRWSVPRCPRWAGQSWKRPSVPVRTSVSDSPTHRDTDEEVPSGDLARALAVRDCHATLSLSQSPALCPASCLCLPEPGTSLEEGSVFQAPGVSHTGH